MKLLIQPGDGIGPLVKAIEKARTSVEIVIFRFDRIEISEGRMVAIDNAIERRPGQLDAADRAGRQPSEHA